MGLKFPDICLTGAEKPGINLTQETCPERESNPGPLRDKRACCRLSHGAYFKIPKLNTCYKPKNKQTCENLHTCSTVFVAMLLNHQTVRPESIVISHLRYTAYTVCPT